MLKLPAFVATAGVVALSLTASQTALAACTRLAFSVNDYGKVGPTNDAKSMLDKYIAKWASDRKIKTYTTGPKEVTCELFLDFIVFDEYTCKAAATVCWNGPLPPGHQVEAATEAPLVNKAATKRSAADGTQPKAAPITTGSVKAAPTAPKAPASVVAPARAAPTAPTAPTAAPPAPAAN